MSLPRENAPSGSLSLESDTDVASGAADSKAKRAYLAGPGIGNDRNGYVAGDRLSGSPQERRSTRLPGKPRFTDSAKEMRLQLSFGI